MKDKPSDASFSRAGGGRGWTSPTGKRRRMSRATCMVIAPVALVFMLQQPAPDTLPRAAERRTFIHTNVFAKTLALAPVRVANFSARQAGRPGATPQVDLSRAELLRAQLVLLEGMNGMSQTLDAARRNSAFAHDRPSMKALSAASDDFMKMSKSFRSMVKELTQVTQASHGSPLPNDDARKK